MCFLFFSTPVDFSRERVSSTPEIFHFLDFCHVFRFLSTSLLEALLLHLILGSHVMYINLESYRRHCPHMVSVPLRATMQSGNLQTLPICCCTKQWLPGSVSTFAATPCAGLLTKTKMWPHSSLSSASARVTSTRTTRGATSQGSSMGALRSSSRRKADG